MTIPLIQAEKCGEKKNNPKPKQQQQPNPPKKPNENTKETKNVIYTVSKY